MNKLIPLHLKESNKNSGFTEYGYICKCADDMQGRIFDNNKSNITIDYEDLIEFSDDEYQSSYINKNQLACPVTTFE